MDWQILGYLIDTVVVVALVQYLKTTGMGWLKLNAPWSLPIIAVAAGVGLPILAGVAAGFFGYTIDFSALMSVLAGTSAIAAFDVKHKFPKIVI